MVIKFTKIKIIETYRMNYDKAYNLNELALFAGRPHQTIKPYAEELVKEGILKKHERKKGADYTLNIKDKRVHDYLSIAEKQATLERMQNDSYIKILFEKLSPYFSNNIFLIFGSAAHETKKGSDIDVIAVGRSDIQKNIKQFEEVYNKKIHLISVEKIEMLSNILAKEIYKKHLILNGTDIFVQYFEDLYEHRMV